MILRFALTMLGAIAVQATLPAHAGDPAIRTQTVQFAKDATSAQWRGSIKRTATVELRGPNAMLCRILFVGGAPVASDSTEAMTQSREGDRTVVKFGADERYDLPDPLIRGG